MALSRPKKPYPTDLVKLYRRFTSERQPLDTLTAALAQQTERRKLIVRLVLEGTKTSEIARTMGFQHGTVRSTLRETMWGMLKKIHNLPRYHRKARPLGRDYGGMKTKQKERRSTQ